MEQELVAVAEMDEVGEEGGLCWCCAWVEGWGCWVEVVVVGGGEWVDGCAYVGVGVGVAVTDKGHRQRGGGREMRGLLVSSVGVGVSHFVIIAIARLTIDGSRR